MRQNWPMPTVSSSACPRGTKPSCRGAAGEFSQGQYQLLAMARALVSRAPILILDEATSSVDTTTEQRLQQATLRLLEGRTCFLIAHRPSTIRRADRIFVVGERGIVESGTYDELMKKARSLLECASMNQSF